MNLLLKILLSLVLAITALFLLEQPVKFGLLHNKDFKISYIQRHKINADVLLDGACQAEMNINPAALTPFTHLQFYNLALTNSDFADNYLFLHHYLQHQQKPKMVFLYVTPEVFDSSYGITFNTYRFVHLLDDPKTAATVRECDPQFAQASVVPFLKYSYYSNFTFYKALKGYMDYFHLTHGTLRQDDGYLAPMHSWEQTLWQFYRTPHYFACSPLNEKYLLKIIQLTKEQHIQLAFFELPLYHEYKKYFVNYDERIKEIQSLASKYTVPYYRFNNASLQSDSTNYFSAYNATAKGSKLMNEVFGSFVRDSLQGLLSEK